jgi:hypothetical protein
MQSQLRFWLIFQYKLNLDAIKVFAFVSNKINYFTERIFGFSKIEIVFLFSVSLLCLQRNLPFSTVKYGLLLSVIEVLLRRTLLISYLCDRDYNFFCKKLLLPYHYSSFINKS